MEQKAGFWQSLYRNLASLKLTVVIFLTLAVASLVGTLLPQGLAEGDLQRHYGPATAKLVEFLGLNDLYHTGWFRFLLLLLCLNLIFCTLERLPKTIKRLRYREDHIDPQKLVKFASHGEILTRLNWEEAQSRLNGVISQEFAAPQRLESPDSYSALAEKGRWSPLMVYVVHFSVLLVLLGALMGSIFGFKGMMNISEGETTGEVMLSSGHESIPLPFQVRCDKFEVSYYDTGAPKEFKSDLAIVEDGKDILKEAIRVNDPLTYKGITFYQATYGTTLKQAEVEFTDRDTGTIYKMTLPFGKPTPLADTKDQVEIVDYQQNLSQFGPALAIVLKREGQPQPTGSWILVKMPEFHGNKIQNYQVKVVKTEPIPYTGLQVKRDPGVWLVWFGFSAMLVGIGLTFYTSHRKLWIWASPPQPGRARSKIIIAGRASKNSLAFEDEFNQLFEHLKDALKSDKKGESKA